MRRLAILSLLYICASYCCAQKYRYPVFDRTDEPRFHIDSVELTEDTTFVYCTYSAEEHSWANISDKTYLENVRNGERVSVLKVSGIPFGPDKRHFIDAEEVDVILYFPHVQSTIFNLIEDEDDKAFNIYGINLNSIYDTSYTAKDINTFFSLATKEFEIENWQTAINYAYKQLEAAKSVEGIKSLPTACAMYNLTLYYCSAKDYEKAIEWGNIAIDILQVLPQDSLTWDVLARAYGCVSTAYMYNDQYEKYIIYKEKSLTIRRWGYGVGIYSYDYYLSTIADDYFEEQNYPKALLFKGEYVDLLEKKFKEDSIRWGCDYILALSKISEFYIKVNRVEKATQCLLKALKLCEEETCGDISILDNILINEARVLSVEGEQLDVALNILEKITQGTNERNAIVSKIIQADIFLDWEKDTTYAINEYESVLKFIEDCKATGKGKLSYSLEYADVLDKLFKVNKDRSPGLSLKYLKKAIKHQKEWHGDESIGYGIALLKYILNFGLSNFGKETDSLLYHLHKSTDIIKRHIYNAFFNLSYYDRTIYWQRYKDVFTWLIPTICGLIKTHDSYALAYDTSLFYKGLLLSSEKDFKDVLLSSNDSTLNYLYGEYEKNLSLLEKKEHSGLNIDSLISVIIEQENILPQIVTRLIPQNQGTIPSWQDVRKKLKEEDIAIEIVSYPSIDESDIYYDAYVIDNKSDAPIIISLFGESQINKCIAGDSIDYIGLSKLIWGNQYMDEALIGKKNIYFSASGQLNSIGIEYLPVANGLSMFDKYNLYRLSSTRELCYESSPRKLRNAYLFGGLDYEYTTHQSIEENKQTMHVSRTVVDSIAKRGGFDPLFGSKQEVKEIKDEMTQHNITCSVYSNSEGSEELFKKLSGSQVDIIHLSTHGMYIPLESIFDKQQDFSFIISDEDSNIDEESAALSRSFLVMSGSNMLIHKESITNGEEDGILTALEISHLDFCDLDLVVLSACQTALGTIDAEGVYGLQRGFKKAGANTILMSLDIVDDEATRILMVEFYKNLMSGKSKLDSLRDAQKYLREMDNGKYSDPKYWASFILLDGLN